MGLLEKLRGELVDIVEWVDDSRHTLVWRFPRYRNQIKQGAKLIVRPGQEAIFVCQGRLADVFEPGTHELTTGNLPILSTIMGWPHGFDSPIKSEIYFVSTRQITDLKWGTPNPVILRDPDFGPLRVRAFGTYTLRAANPATLLEELVGTDGSFEADEVTELLRSMIVESFARVIGGLGIPALDLAANYPTVAARVREDVAARIDDEYGLEVPQLMLVNLSLPEEVEQAVDARSSMAAIGDMNAFQAYQMGKAIPAAASAPGGGAAGEGMGLGMGLAMAGRLMQTPGVAGGLAAAPSSAPVPPPLPVSLWHLVLDGATHGPVDAGRLTELVAAGTVRPETLLWSAGMDGWTPAARIPQVSAMFSAAAPPPPPPPPASAD